MSYPLFDQGLGEPKSTKGPRVEPPRTDHASFDFVEHNLRNRKAKANVLEVEHIIKCLKEMIGKNQNLTADEYQALQKGADADINFNYVKMTTTLETFSKAEAKQELERAEQMLERVEQKLKEAKQEREKAEQKLQELKHAAGNGTPFVFEASLGSKKRVPCGVGVALLGKLFGRENGLRQIMEGYSKLATMRGSSNADKKAVPILACAAQSGTGKTEMLKYVHNYHGHFSDGNDNLRADEVMALINQKSPAGTMPLEKIVTLFCSFNQTSTFVKSEEEVIVETTTERLIRSYRGCVNYVMAPTDNPKATFGTLLAEIPMRVGVIVCVDEIAKLSDGARRTLLDVLMTACQIRIVEGGFCAVVGTALFFHETWGKSIYTDSNRVVHPFTLLPRASDVDLLDTITNKLKSIDGLADGSEYHDVTLHTAARILSQTPKPEEWVLYFGRLLSPGRHFLNPPSMMTIPAIDTDASTIFEWLAPDILGCNPVSMGYWGNELITKKIEYLYGDYIITSGASVTDIAGDIMLPAIRFLQIKFKTDTKYVESWVQNTLVECATATGDSIAKRWEKGVMALLEVWRAAARATCAAKQEASLGSLPFFDSSFPKADCIVHRIKDTSILATLLPNTALPLAAAENILGMWHSPRKNEAYIEGTVRYNDDVCLLFQNKMYTELRKEDFVTAMVKLGKKEAQLRDAKGTTTYVSVLITTGVTPKTLRSWIGNHAASDDWPRNYVVVTKGAVEALVRPFGAGMLESMLSSLTK